MGKSVGKSVGKSSGKKCIIAASFLLLCISQFSMMRSQLTSYLPETAASLFSSPSSSSSSQEEEEDAANAKKGPLNILVLYPDDWRHDHIADENPQVITPFLTRIAREGIRFTHNCVTTSVCWISRATLFSGQWGVKHDSAFLYRPNFCSPIRWHNASWPGLLQSVGGYFVGHVGKWQFEDRHKNLKNGLFNYTRIFEGDHWYDRLDEETGEVVEKHVSGARLAEFYAVDFLRNARPKDVPFALTVAFYPPKAVTTCREPGCQWQPPPEYRAMYNETNVTEVPYDTALAHHVLPPFLKEKLASAWGDDRFRTAEHYTEAMRNYFALITSVDDACANIVAELERQGVENETLIIFTTDNGMFHYEHRFGGKWYPYQESIRVPLIVRDPRMPKKKLGTLDDSLVLNVDLAETILGAAGIAPSESMQGRDIADLYLGETKLGGKYFDGADTIAPIKDPDNVTAKSSVDMDSTNVRRKHEQNPWRTDFFYHFPQGHFNKGKSKGKNERKHIPASKALVTHEWKYIRFDYHRFDQRIGSNKSKAYYEQLFDLKNDPFELNDLYNNKSWAERLVIMKIRFEELEPLYS